MKNKQINWTRHKKENLFKNNNYKKKTKKKKKSKKNRSRRRSIMPENLALIWVFWHSKSATYIMKHF